MSKKWTTIVTHANCVDGYLSALVLLECYPEARVIFHQYGGADPALPEENEEMIFCDVSPPKHLAEAFFAAGAVLLDHHRSAVPVFEAKGARGAYSAMPGVSGAVLAFEYGRAFPWRLADSRRGEVEDIASLVGIYDTWDVSSRRFEEATAAHAALDLVMRDTTYPLQGATRALAKILDDWRTVLLPMGRMLVRQSAARAAKAASRAILRETEIGNRKTSVGLLVDSLTTAELNLAARLVQAELVLSAKFGEPLADFMFEEDVHCSLRAGAIASEVDCGALAAVLGGGGHKGAAGFAIRRGGAARPVYYALGRLVEGVLDGVAEAEDCGTEGCGSSKCPCKRAKAGESEPKTMNTDVKVRRCGRCEGSARFVCICDRCEREPEDSEKFMACLEHRAGVGVEHRRVRETEPRWMALAVSAAP